MAPVNVTDANVDKRRTTLEGIRPSASIWRPQISRRAGAHLQKAHVVGRAPPGEPPQVGSASSMSGACRGANPAHSATDADQRPVP